MSLSSETTNNRPELVELGYDEGHFGAGYYVAKCGDDLGVCVAPVGTICMVQLFPWGSDKWEMPGQAKYVIPLTSHGRYSRFLWKKSSAPISETIWDYPYFKCPVDTDLLTIKCLIEEGIKQWQASSKSL